MRLLGQEKRKAKKERQRRARAQAAAREAPSLAVGSSAGPSNRPALLSAAASVSPELLAAEQKPGSPAQAGAPAVEAVLQAAGHVSAEPAEALPQPAPGEGRKDRKEKGEAQQVRGASIEAVCIQLRQCRLPSGCALE